MNQQTTTSEIETIELHNAVAIYGLNEDGSEVEQPIMSFYRPQDWGNPKRWHYEFFRLEWVHKNKKYINNCHCWTDLKNPKGGYPLLFAEGIAMILMPGHSPQECGRDYLRGDDFWCEEWGEMPPYYDPTEEYDDDEIYD